MQVDKSYNIGIIGGGPAGITAGIYAKYDGNKPIIFEAKTLAWNPEKHVNLLDKLEGFPGLLNTVNGTELITKFKNSLRDMNVDYLEHCRVTAVASRKNEFIISTNKKQYNVKTVIIATGTNPIKPNLTLKDDIYYYAYDNYKKYINKEVIVLGSRNSGSTAAIYLARKGLKVTIIEIKDKVQAKEKHTKFFKNLGIKTITGATIDGFKLKKVS